jgi:putative alpha-1,2-mannosidase
MSAWFVFSALGFYPVNPVSAEYVVGTCVSLPLFHPHVPLSRYRGRPFFDKITVRLPGAPKPLVVSASGATTMPYVRSVTVNGERLEWPVIRHEQIAGGGEVIFEMSEEPQSWGSETLQ